MNWKSKSGFTLAELMIVISIIGVLAVVSIPSFVKRNEAQKLRNAASQISRSVLMMRQKAVSSKRKYRIEFNYGLGEYQILTERTPGNWELDPPDNRYKLPRGILMSTTSDPVDGIIVVEPRGTVAVADLPVNIRLKDSKNRTKRIEVYRSGMVKESTLWE